MAIPGLLLYHNIRSCVYREKYKLKYHQGHFAALVLGVFFTSGEGGRGDYIAWYT